MNRTFAILVIGILVIGIILLGVFLGQKMSDINDLKLQLSESQQTAMSVQAQLTSCQQNLAVSQTQLNQSQQNVATLQTQLTGCQQNTSSLQTQLNECQGKLDQCMAQPLICGQPVTNELLLPGHYGHSFNIDLQPPENLQVEIWATSSTPAKAYIQDPSGKTIKDFGQTMHTNFKFTAEMQGTYSVVIENPIGETRTYRVTYTICHKP